MARYRVKEGWHRHAGRMIEKGKTFESPSEDLDVQFANKFERVTGDGVKRSKKGRIPAEDRAEERRQHDAKIKRRKKKEAEEREEVRTKKSSKKLKTKKVKSKKGKSRKDDE